MTDVLTSTSVGRELERRTIRRTDWVSCNAAFIDCRTPGSDRKENYAFIGSGVSQNADQFVNLTELHGYNVGAAGMPNGVTNNLHLHFTAEVFINFGGTFRVRWGVDGKQGEYVSPTVTSSRCRPGSSAASPTRVRTTASCSPCSVRTSPAASSGDRRCCGGRVVRAAPDRGQPADRHRRRRRAARGRAADQADAAGATSTS